MRCQQSLKWPLPSPGLTALYLSTPTSVLALSPGMLVGPGNSLDASLPAAVWVSSPAARLQVPLTASAHAGHGFITGVSTSQLRAP